MESPQKQAGTQHLGVTPKHVPPTINKSMNERLVLITKSETENIILKDKYQLQFFNKAGGFGEVYIAKHITKDYEVAIKFSDISNEEAQRQYQSELMMLKFIKKLHNSKGFPRLLTAGCLESKKLNYIVITKFDADLEFMFTQQKRNFSIQCILTIGMQMLDLLERFHSTGYIHSDLKPQNIMTKFGQNQVFLIDFGLVQKIKQKSAIKFRGTPYFASNNSLQRQGNGPKDDLESLVYILIYFYLGDLPWNKNIPVMKDDIMSNMQIQQVLEQRYPYKLCDSMDPEFPQMLTYLQELSSKKKPDYKMIRRLFEQMMDRHHCRLQLDWCQVQQSDVLRNTNSSLTKMAKAVRSENNSQQSNESGENQLRQKTLPPPRDNRRQKALLTPKKMDMDTDQTVQLDEESKEPNTVKNSRSKNLSFGGGKQGQNQKKSKFRPSHLDKKKQEKSSYHSQSESMHKSHYDKQSITESKNDNSRQGPTIQVQMFEQDLLKVQNPNSAPNSGRNFYNLLEWDDLAEFVDENVNSNIGVLTANFRSNDLKKVHLGFSEYINT